MDGDIAIVGGGLSALSSGLALAQSGHQVVIVDPRPAEREDFWGLVLWPSGTKSLAALGVRDDVLAAGASVRAIQICSPAGVDWVNIDTDGLGVGTFIGILPSRLDRALRSHALRAGVTIHDGAGPVAVERLDRGWSITFDGAAGLTVKSRLLLAADGPNSPIRERIGLGASRWRPKYQQVLTGIGGAIPRSISRQLLGPGWSAGHAALGDCSWLYAVTREKDAEDQVDRVRRMQPPEPGLAEAAAKLGQVARLRPWQINLDRWATDGAMAIGDAAHAMLPYFGLGGTLSLEDVPVLVDVVDQALRTDDLGAAVLGRFQHARARRIAYAQRVSGLYALTLTRNVRGFAAMRSLQLRYIARNGPLMGRYFRDLANSAVPSLRTRVRLGIP